jgi:hypothetical protein
MANLERIATKVAILFSTPTFDSITVGEAMERGIFESELQKITDVDDYLGPSGTGQKVIDSGPGENKGFPKGTGYVILEGQYGKPSTLSFDLNDNFQEVLDHFRN